jgi:thiol-disulfide isomerase/thioredoxin
MRPGFRSVLIFGLLSFGFFDAGDLFWPVAAPASTTPATQPLSRADLARYQRGEKIRQVLLDALEQSYQNNGPWPDQLPAGAIDLVYIKPPNSVIPDENGSIIQANSNTEATVVVHERLDQHPDGVWVGYADGHLEFAPDAAALRNCQAQLPILARRAAAPSTQPAPAGGQVTLMVLDPDGKPTGGAKVGTYMSFGFTGIKAAQPTFAGEDSKTSLVSDDKGIVTLPASIVFDAKFFDEPSVPVYVYQKERQLIGQIDLNREDVSQNKTLTVRLVPACNVSGRLTSVGLWATGKNISWTNAIVFKPGLMGLYTMQCSSQAGVFGLPLPPGDYGLKAYGTDCQSAYRYFSIEPGQRELRLQIDLPPSTVAQLVGKPAPQLREIKGWINSEPLKIADLRGKLVLLDFWGYWCGPCVGSMPAMMKLYDQTRDKGLVIIAVHDDSLPSIAELNQKLDEIRQEAFPGWNGRNLPFPIALDGGGQTRIKYSSFTARGATTAAYGINSFPTTIAIGRDGNVIGEVSVRSDDGIRHIEELLDSKEAAKN